MSDLRKVEKLTNGVFEEIIFEYLKKGDTFRLYDDDELVKNNQGCSKFLAISEIYLTEENILAINTTGIADADMKCDLDVQNGVD